MINQNDLLPEGTVFCLENGDITAAKLRGANLVLYFYPRDDTPGCTTESKDFSENYPAFQKANCEVVGISRDNLKSHKKFSDKYGFPFPLASDEDEKLCQLFDVIKPKNMYGKKYMGIERSTFVFDASGKLLHQWRKVKVPGHVAEVLETVQNIK